MLWKRKKNNLDNSLPKNLLIRSHKDFNHILKFGNSININNHFKIVYNINSLDHARVGYIVSKKVSSKAVIRNRIKRLIREYFRQNKSYFGSKDVIFICKKDISDWKPEMIEDVVESALGLTELK